MIGVIAGVTNIIPYVGPIVGAEPPTLGELVVSGPRCLGVGLV